MKYNIKYNAENTAALTLVLWLCTVLMNSNYIEIPFLSFIVRNLPLMCISLCNTLHLGDRRMTTLPNCLSQELNHGSYHIANRSFMETGQPSGLLVTYYLTQVSQL